MLLSIITTLYKSEPYLRKCLDSLLNQDLPNTDYELVLVDDGSPDNCVSIIKEEYQTKYPNIVLIRRSNGGLPEARNTGLENANGKYVTFVDPDDYVETNVYGKLINKIQNENLDMLRYNYTMVEEETYRLLPKYKESLKTVDYTDSIVTGEAFLGERLGFACYVWQFISKKTLFTDNNIRFREKVFDDADVLPRLIIHANRVTSVDTNVYYYTQRKGSLFNAITPQSAEKKINGWMFLSTVYNELYTNIKLQSTKRWFSAMMTTAYLGIFQTSAQYVPNKQWNYIELFKQNNRIPMSLYGRIWTKRIHIIGVVLMPKLYTWFYKKIY
ncbi:MAG: glycosyltransferase [Paludibacteraceae bacterium]|nr:glycosyltransferase [Paludibacteraceae bacterium]